MPLQSYLHVFDGGVGVGGFSVFLLVTLTFAGASVAARRNQRIGIELIEYYLPPPLKKAVSLLLVMLFPTIALWLPGQKGFLGGEW